MRRGVGDSPQDRAGEPGYVDARCRIELLGGLQVRQANRLTSRFATRQTGALLAYLAFHRQRSHPRDTLSEILWPGADLLVGRRKLRKALSALRLQLEPPGVPPGAVIQADRAVVRLNPAAGVTDVAEFEAALEAVRRARSRTERGPRLEDAVALYQGELLPGYLDDWIIPERMRLTAAYQQACCELARHSEQGDDFPRAVEHARRAVAADPLREEAQQELIHLLVASGDAGGARRQFAELERLLARELGLEPAAETRALLLQAPNVRARARTGGAAAPRVAKPAEAEEERGAAAGAAHPTGTVNFLMVEMDRPESTASPREDASLETDLWAGLRGDIRLHSGHVVRLGEGSLLTVFARASDALAAAVAGMKRVTGPEHGEWEGPPGPQRAARQALRMALHAGAVDAEAAEYGGTVRDHTTRLLLAAHPGQILCSEAAAALLRAAQPAGVDGYALADLGVYRLGHSAAEAGAWERLFHVLYPGTSRREFPAPRAAVPLAGRLPLRLTRFFGREREIAHLRALLLGEAHSGGGSEPRAARIAAATGSLQSPPSSIPNRLVTLVGPGGSGKTRLALEVADRMMEPFGGAVWFASLADLAEASQIPGAIRDALKLPHSPYLEPLEQVVESLSHQASLLVLDNFEHLVEDGVAAVCTLLERLPALQLLVTSRQRLDLEGEQEFPVGPLPVPGEGMGARVGSAGPDPVDCAGAYPPHPTPHTLLQVSSIVLFVDRAQAAQPGFQLTAANATAVAALCERLEGLPLALELAAARAGTRAPAQMLQQIEHRFQFLVSKKRNVTPRHRSLWATLDWSYELLSPRLQQFFAQLCVFRGGCTLAAVEAVCAPMDLAAIERATGDALDGLERLQGCSLLTAESVTVAVPGRCLPAVVAQAGVSLAMAAHRPPLAETRYRLLETMREYGWERLVSEEQRATVHARHLAYFLEFAETATCGLTGAEQAAWLARLEWEYDNLHAALTWAEQVGPEAGLRLATALAPFWEVRGRWSEGRQWLHRFLACTPAAAELRAAALVAAGRLASSQADYDAAAGLLTESLALSRRAGDRRSQAGALHQLGNIALSRSEFPEARALLANSLSLWKELDDRRGVAAVLHSLGLAAIHQGDNPGARALYKKSLAIREALGDQRGIAAALGQLGVVARVIGDSARAQEFSTRSLSLYWELNDPRGIGVTLQSLGRLATDRGDVEQARALYEASREIRTELGDRSGIAMVLQTLGQLDHAAGNYAEAQKRHEECLAIRSELGEKREAAISLFDLANALRAQGHVVQARRLYRESLRISQAIGARPSLIRSLEGLAMAAGLQDQPARAARLFGSAAALRALLRDQLRHTGRQEYDLFVASTRARLGKAAFAAAWEAGRDMTLEQALTLALRDDTPS